MEIKCPKCGCAVLEDSVICTRCGAPRPTIIRQQAQIRNMTEREYCAANGIPYIPQPIAALPQAQPLSLDKNRKVGGGLVLGIVFMPYLFAWFTLRSGYSRRSRIAAFIWLGIIVFSLIPKR